jgi:hypothetical protein
LARSTQKFIELKVEGIFTQGTMEDQGSLDRSIFREKHISIINTYELLKYYF